MAANRRTSRGMQLSLAAAAVTAIIVSTSKRIKVPRQIIILITIIAERVLPLFL